MIDFPETRHPLRGFARTVAALAALTTAAVAFSYLGAYAFAGVLVAADVLERWPPAADPRPRWMALIFAYLTGSFLLASGCLKWTSARQMRRLDASGEGDG